MQTAVILLSLIVFLPSLAALVLALLIPKEKTEVVRLFTLGTTAVVMVLSLWLLLPGGEGAVRFQPLTAEMQNAFTLRWIPTFNIYYTMGTDGISFPLVILTTVLSFLAAWASWSIQKHVKAYSVLFLILETGMLGVFLALDFFLFFLFWEVMLLPMYFLIGVWGGPRREYAAIKFFLYTLVGGVFMVIAILMLYFSSDLRALRTATGVPTAWNQLYLDQEVLRQVQAQGTLPLQGTQGSAGSLVVVADYPGAEYEGTKVTLAADPALKETEIAADWNSQSKELKIRVGGNRSTVEAVALAEALEASEAGRYFSAQLQGARSGSVSLEASTTVRTPGPHDQPVHTFNMLSLMLLGQHTDVFNYELLGATLQWWAFLLLFVGFAIKVPVVPVHTWLPDAHVEAPTPISMILAGVLLKMGGYGIIRICYPMCPQAAYDLAWFVCFIGVLSMVYGAFAAMAQKDFKRLVAYSSVSHMGYVILGLGVWSATASTEFTTHYWQLGMNGAMFQMLAHGVSSAGMFFLVGVVYDRVHHRNLDEFGGLFQKMPVYSGISIVIFFAAMGLPGLCGFIGEVFVTLSAWKYSTTLAVISASVVILTAGYILWTVQRVYLGPEYKGPHGEALTPMTLRERAIAAPLVAFAILLGVLPQQTVFNYMSPSVNKVVEDLTAWNKRSGASLPAVQAAQAQEEQHEPLAAAQRD